MRLGSPSPSPRPQLAAVAVAACAVGLLGCGGDSVEVTTSILDHGAESGRLTLPVPAEVGQRAEGTIELEMDVSAAGYNFDTAMRFDVASEVIEVSDDGTYVTREAWTSGELTSANSEVESQLRDEIPTEFTLRSTMDAAGQVVESEVIESDSLSPSERDAAERLADDADTGVAVFPTEPIGLGARWADTMTHRTEGLEFSMTIDNELVELTDDGYQLDLTIDDEIDESVDGESLSGAVVGSGSFRGRTQNPLVSSGSMTMTIDVSGGGQSAAITMDVAIDLTEPDA